MMTLNVMTLECVSDHILCAMDTLNVSMIMDLIQTMMNKIVVGLAPVPWNFTILFPNNLFKRGWGVGNNHMQYRMLTKII